MSTTKQLTNAILKGIMTDTVATRNVASNLDNITTAGMYQVAPEQVKAGYPVGAYKYGVVAVFRTHGFATQVYCPHQRLDGLPLYVRAGYCPSGTMSWRPWFGFEGIEKAKT